MSTKITQYRYTIKEYTINTPAVKHARTIFSFADKGSGFEVLHTLIDRDIAVYDGKDAWVEIHSRYIVIIPILNVLLMFWAGQGACVSVSV